jgi:hypothetical protein
MTSLHRTRRLVLLCTLLSSSCDSEDGDAPSGSGTTVDKDTTSGKSAARASDAAYERDIEVPSDSGERPAPDAQSPAAQADDRVWYVLHAYDNRPARFVTFASSGAADYVEASSPNLEQATVTSVHRGALSLDTWNTLKAELRPALMDGAPPRAGGEQVEEADLLVDVRGAVDARDVSWIGVRLQDLPAPLGAALERTANEASKLGSHTPAALAQTLSVVPERAERIANDSRGVYKFVSVDASTLAGRSDLTATIADEGRVVELEASTETLVSEWWNTSNPSHSGNSIFLNVKDGPHQGSYQLQYQDLDR